MAGVQLVARVGVTSESEAIRRALASLVEGLVDLAEPMDEIGASLVASTQQRFFDEEGPDGEPWAELAPATQERIGAGGKPRGPDHMLRVKGHMFRRLTHVASRTEVAVGLNAVQAAIQQLGGEDDMAPGPAAVPARPFLGLSRDDEREIGEIMLGYLDGLV